MKLLLIPLIILGGSLIGKDPYILWNENPILLREYLLTVSDNLPDQAQQISEKMFLTNQKELGATFQPYYEPKVTQELEELFKTQGNGIIALIATAKKGDPKQFDREFAVIKQNATAISNALSKANPYISFCKIQDMLFTYLDLISSMVTDRFKTKWQDDAENYAKVRAHFNEIASSISQALTNAFPRKEDQKTPSKQS